MNDSSGQKPVREGLFVTGDPPRLLGSRCRETGQLFYPQQVMNPVTHREGTMEPAEIAGDGTLLNYTIVARGMPGFASPFALGVVELAEGIKLTAQLTEWQDVDLKTGMPVSLRIGMIKREKDGTEVIGPMFRPADREGNV